MRSFLSAINLRLLACGLLLPVSAAAQGEKDLEFRGNLGVSWEAGKNTTVNAGYRYTAFDNLSRFKSSMFSIGGSQDVLKWLRLGGEYRFYTTPEQDYHRFQVFARAGYKVNKKIDLFYRLQYQQRQDYFDGEYLQYFPPERIFRNRLLGRYQYSKKLELYGYAESFTERRRGDFRTYRMRYGVGTEYEYKKRHVFGLELFANDEFNRKSPNDRLTIDVSYVFKIKKRKEKKEEKAAKEPQ